MTRRRSLVPLSLALLGVILVAACSRSDDPGKDVVTDELTAVWADLGVDPDEARVQGYGVDRQSDADAETSEWCRDRDQSDRWVASRSATLRDGLVTQDDAIEGMARRYRGLDATSVRLFRSTAGSGGVVFVAVDDGRGIVVDADISVEGYVSLGVRHSECPLDVLSTEPNGPYEEVPVPGA